MLPLPLPVPLVAVGVTAALALTPAPAVAPSAARGDVDWPLRPGPAVVRDYDPPDRPWLPGHRGVDLAAAAGATVLSPADGVVTFAGPVAGRTVVTVTHTDGLRSSMEPVADPVPVGTAVRRGDPVALVSTAVGHCPGPCLHWGVRQPASPARDEYLDPLSLLGRPDPPVLLTPRGVVGADGRSTGALRGRAPPSPPGSRRSGRCCRRRW